MVPIWEPGALWHQTRRVNLSSCCVSEWAAGEPLLSASPESSLICICLSSHTLSIHCLCHVKKIIINKYIKTDKNEKPTLKQAFISLVALSDVQSEGGAQSLMLSLHTERNIFLPVTLHCCIFSIYHRSKLLFLFVVLLWQIAMAMSGNKISLFSGEVTLSAERL